MAKNILCLILFCFGTGIVWFQEGLMTYIGIFLLMWANNIGFMRTIENMNKQEKSILKLLFGDNISKEKLEEVMSHNMRVSDK